MVILGVSHPISHNNAACIIVDGRLIAFAEEERFVRYKHAPNMYPALAIEFCLREAGIGAHQVDITAVGFAAPEKSSVNPSLVSAYLNGTLNPTENFDFRTGVSLLQHDTEIVSYGTRKYYDHHLSHAASALIPSGFASANIISLDGWGGACSGMLGWRKDKGDIHVHKMIPAENSWGMVYELVTYYLGFRPHSGEGKTMGLAPYGLVDTSLLPDFCDPVLGLPDVKKYREYLGQNLKVRARNAPFDAFHKNLAATLQHYYERSLIAIGRELQHASGLSKYALAGGVALNCTGNGALASQEFVEDIFIQPSAHDAGTALGAAILAHREVTGNWPDVEFKHAYWGSGYTQDQIRQALDFSGANYTEVDPSRAGGDALANDLLLGFFQGRAEAGPRALGNRSILANPGTVLNRDRVNVKVKRRENWRPFAPSVLASEYHAVVDARVNSPFMILAFQARDEWKDKLPAVVHVDGSCRPQAVNPDTNPIYHGLITRFRAQTGLPAVLNTSFNMEDEPIVNSPENAIATFFRSGLDALVIGNFMIRKPDKLK